MCRQEIIGRATNLEKIVASFYKRITGREAPAQEASIPHSDHEDNDLPDELLDISIFFPNFRRTGLDIEMDRLFANLSVLQGPRS